MRKELVLGNGHLFVNFDEYYNMRDFYYPHVGKYNHLGGSPNGLAVWVDDRFSWIDNTWQRRFSYEKKSLCTLTVLRNEPLGVELVLRDCIHKRTNVLLKTIEVKNLRENAAVIRVCFYHWFTLKESPIGNTAYYHPKLNALIHYKGRTCLMIWADGDFDYTTAQRSGHAGSWQEIETGRLKRTPIVQGEVDSALMLTCQAQGGQSITRSYAIAAGINFDALCAIKAQVDRLGVEAMMGETLEFWRAWIREKNTLSPALPLSITSLYSRSLLVIRAHMDHGGAILAANDTEIYKFNKDHYSYMWPRDGAFTAITLCHAGYGETTRRFFEFCAEHLSHEGYLLHKYSPDGTAGSSWHPWVDEEGNFQLPIQEDETALVIVALWEYYRATKDIEFVDALYERFTRPASQFLIDYRDTEGLPLPSYDLWEERRGIMAYTCATVHAGLRSAASLAALSGAHDHAAACQKAAAEVKSAVEQHLYDAGEGRFVRGLIKSGDGWLCDLGAESSVSALYELEMFEAKDPRIVNTMRHLKEKLWIKTGIGGLARYEGDYYHQIDTNLPGNPWIVTTLWLANWHIDCGELDEGRRLLEWAIERKSGAGLLAEQYNPLDGAPLSVNPLTWSHASFCYTALKLSRKLLGQ
ncbi:MAG: glycoside hydrolase family 15 protein [Campylobacterales bacterium]